MVGDHVAHAPAAVRDEALHRLAEERLALVLGELLGDGDHGVDGQEADRVLVVAGELAEGGEEVLDELVVRELLGERAELLGRGSPRHGRVVVAQLGEHLDELVLDRARRLGVRGGEQGRGRGARREPLAGCEAADERDKVLVDLVLRQEGAHGVGRLGGLVAHERLLDAGEVLEEREDGVGVVGSADVLDEGCAELFCEGDEDLVVVVERLLEEGEELGAGALWAEGDADGRDAVDGVETEGDVLCPQLVDCGCKQWGREGASVLALVERGRGCEEARTREREVTNRGRRWGGGDLPASWTWWGGWSVQSLGDAGGASDEEGDDEGEAVGGRGGDAGRCCSGCGGVGGACEWWQEVAGARLVLVERAEGQQRRTPPSSSTSEPPSPTSFCPRGLRWGVEPAHYRLLGLLAYRTDFLDEGAVLHLRERRPRALALTSPHRPP